MNTKAILPRRVNIEGLASDKWFSETLDLGRNDRCPCGCGKKWKAAVIEHDKHEAQFITDFKNKT